MVLTTPQSLVASILKKTLSSRAGFQCGGYDILSEHSGHSPVRPPTTPEAALRRSDHRLWESHARHDERFGITTHPCGQQGWSQASCLRNLTFAEGIFSDSSFVHVRSNLTSGRVLSVTAGQTCADVFRHPAPISRSDLKLPDVAGSGLCARCHPLPDILGSTEAGRTGTRAEAEAGALFQHADAFQVSRPSFQAREFILRVLTGAV